MRDARFVLAGAGAAGTGIARLLRVAMVEEGVTPEQARDSIAVLDSFGLLVEGRPALDDDKYDAALPREVVTALGLDPDGAYRARGGGRAHSGPTSCWARPGAVAPSPRARSGRWPRPRTPDHPAAVEPDGNTEARPADVLAWSDGRAIVATGCPFAPVEFGGPPRRIAQANNAYVFPGIGLGAIVSEARTLPEYRVPRGRPAARGHGACGVARLAASCSRRSADLRAVAREIAIAVVEHLGELGVGRRFRPDASRPPSRRRCGGPRYVPYEAV